MNERLAVLAFLAYSLTLLVVSQAYGVDGTVRLALGMASGAAGGFLFGRHVLAVA